MWVRCIDRFPGEGVARRTHVCCGVGGAHLQRRSKWLQQRVDELQAQQPVRECVPPHTAQQAGAAAATRRERHRDDDGEEEAAAAAATRRERHRDDDGEEEAALRRDEQRRRVGSPRL
jgi:hypothetical protein